MPRAYLMGREGPDPSRWKNDWQLFSVRRRSPASCEEHLCPCPGGRAHLTPLCQQHHTEAGQSFPFESPQYKIKGGVFCFGFLGFFFGQPWGYFFPLDVGNMFLTFRIREIKTVVRRTVSEEVMCFHTQSQNSP